MGGGNDSEDDHCDLLMQCIMEIRFWGLYLVKGRIHTPEKVQFER